MKERITDYDMLIVADCLHGSLRVADRAIIWRFTEEQRKAVLMKLYEIMSSTPSKVQDES